MLSLFMKWAV